MIYESLLRKGVPEERLREIHAPVGLDLGGRAPEEIALSIVSEIVAWRNGREGGPMTMEPFHLDRLVAKVNGAAAPR